MPRPTKCRHVGFIPQVTFFKPAGIPMRVLESVVISMEELEAIRLKDYEGLDQEAGATEMGVSRATFRRVLQAARATVAEAFVTGKGIRIEGGIFETEDGRLRCGWDGHEWDLPEEGAAENDVRVCPKCRRSNVAAIDALAGDAKKGACRRGHGWERWSSGGETGER